MDDSEFSVDVEGGVLHGRRSGRGIPLLVLHGGPGLSDYSEMLREETVGWDVISYTQRGPRPSSAREPFTVEAHVADAVAVLDHHGVDRAVLIGHSWGACLACLLAAQAPDRVRGVVLVDGLGMSGDGGEAEFSAEVTARIAPAETSPGPGATGSEPASDPVGIGTATESADLDDVTGALALVWRAYFADWTHAPGLPDGLVLSAQANYETLASLRATMADPGLALAMRAYTGPVEVLHGEKSPMPAHAATDTAAMFADAAVTTVPGAGHLVWHEAPGSVKAALDRLAARLP